MPDSKRKQLYTFLCAVCTILVIFAARKLPAMPPPLAEEHLTWFGGGLFMMVFGAILDVIIVIILGTIAYISQWQPHPPWIHKKHPQQSARHTLLMPLEDAFQAVIGRAAASNFHPVGLGFPVAESTQAAGERSVCLQRPAATPVSSFLSNPFQIDAVLTGRDSRSTTIDVTVTETATLVVESGERDWLKEMAEYYAMASEQLRIRQLYVNTDSTVMLAATAIILLTALPADARLAMPLVIFFSAGAVGASFTGLVTSLIRPRQFHSLPLFLWAAALGASPLAIAGITHR